MFPPTLQILFVCVGGLILATSARLVPTSPLLRKEARGSAPYHSSTFPPESLSASSSFLGSLQSNNSRLDPFFFVINNDISQAIVNLDTLCYLPDQGSPMVADNLSSICLGVPQVVRVELLQVFGQGRLFGLVTSDGCKVIQSSGVARVIQRNDNWQ